MVRRFANIFIAVLHTSDRPSMHASCSRSARQGTWVPDLYDLYDRYDLYDLYDLYDMYELYDLYDLAHVAGWKPYNLHDLGHISWVGSVLYRS